MIASILILSGCSTTDLRGANFYVATNAGKGCSVTRGSTSDQQSQGGGEASASALDRALSGAGSGTLVLVRAMSSTTECKPDDEDDEQGDDQPVQ